LGALIVYDLTKD